MHHPAHFTTLGTAPLPRGMDQGLWLADANDRRRVAPMVQRLAMALIMGATFALGAAVMAATAPTADRTGQPLEAPPGLDL